MSMYSGFSDMELVALLKKDNQLAFEVLHHRYRLFIYRYALRICKQEEAAEEIAQNVMLKIWQQRQQINTELNFKGWLSKIAANQSFDFLKSLAKEHALKEKVWLKMQQSPLFYTEDEYVLKEYLVLIDEAVNTLPLQQQKIYRMSREKDLTYDEIAKALNISSHTVRNHMASALSHIRNHIKHNTSAALPPVIAVCLICGNL